MEQLKISLPAKDIILDLFIRYGFQVIGAAVILIAGFLVSRWAAEATLRALSHKEMEPPVRALIGRVIRLLVIGLTVVIALDKLEVQVAPLIAGIGVAGVGIGLALQGVLGNLVA